MTEKIDIAEILKDKPANTKLYSPLFGEVDFSHVGGDNIAVEHHGGISLFFSSGRFFDLDESEPLLFPSKEMRNWSKYRPFANVEECWQEMLKHQPFGWVKNNNFYRNILETSDGAIFLPSFPGEMFVFSFNKAKEKFTFADGTPFGVKVEE